MNKLMENYTLIVTEKPDAAKRIAHALDNQGNPQSCKMNGVPYFVAQRDRQLVVVPSIGHLYTIVQDKGKRSHYPVFDFTWAPRHVAERNSKRLRNWVETFSELSSGADRFISACDYDVEGCLIGYCILKFACRDKDKVAKRMKFSTLTKTELEKAYEEPLSHLDFGLIESGRTRHEADWLYGINLSRALTLSAKKSSGRYSTLSTGRVQGPTLQLLAAREKAIRSFVPTPYWEIAAEARIRGSVVQAEYEKKPIETQKEAKTVVANCHGKTGEIKKVDVRIVHQKPPVPFDLGTLQREAYSLFGYTPKRTLSIAQRLYVSALISYPRTSSQKLPPVIGYRKILKALARKSGYKGLASKLLKQEKLTPKEGTKDDPAHPAVYPTGNLPEKPLSTPEKRVWDLIVRRFMAVFGEDATKESIKADLEVNEHRFFLKGRRILTEGWMVYYKPYLRNTEVILPQLKTGDTAVMKKVELQDKFTCPPSRYNPSSLLKKMEELGIGTKATRADIIQTLYNRRYVMDERIAVTELGFDVIDVLDRYASTVVSALLTKELENKMEQIRKGNINREEVIKEVVEELEPQLLEFKENEEAIGKALTKAITKAKTQELTIGKCPNCSTGELAVITSRTTNKRFIGCTNYFNGLCQTSFPLPQRGTIKPSKSNCKSCGWPTVLVWLRGKKPWNLCFNLNCSSKRRSKQ